MTSGLGGRFPEGYPVAVVSSVKVDNQRAYTVIKARPTAGLQRLRYLLLLWSGDRDGTLPLPPDAVQRRLPPPPRREVRSRPSRRVRRHRAVNRRCVDVGIP